MHDGDVIGEASDHDSLAAVPRQRKEALGLSDALGISVHTTRRGKFLVWAEILDSLRLRGDERVLDVGCGRGAVLTMVAERLPRGRVVGIDLWTADQSGNGAEAAERNLVAEGVRERCKLVTGDMRSMPFRNASIDMIVSSLAIHNIRILRGEFGPSKRSHARWRPAGA
jgi:arsenite methyltransferase